MSVIYCLFRIRGRARVSKESLQDLEERPIGDLVSSVPKQMRVGRLRRIPDAVEEPHVSKVEDSRRAIQVVLSFNRRVRVVGAGGRYQYAWVPSQYVVYLRKGSSLLAVEGTSLPLSALFAGAIQWFLTGEAVSVERFQLETKALSRIIEWISSDVHSRPGSIVRATFQQVPSEDGFVFDEMTLAGPGLCSSKLFQQVFETDAQFVRLSMVTPLFQRVSRQFRCRLDARGRLTVTTQELTVPEGQALLDELESVLL